LVEDDTEEGSEDEEDESDAEPARGELRFFGTTRREGGGFLVEEGERILRVGHPQEKEEKEEERVAALEVKVNVGSQS